MTSVLIPPRGVTSDEGPPHLRGLEALDLLDDSALRLGWNVGTPFCRAVGLLKNGLMLLTVVFLLMCSWGTQAAESPSGEAVQKTEFVRVPLDRRATISGETLMVTAYSVTFVLFVLYVLSLYIRFRAIEKSALALRRRIDIRTTAEDD